jgi:hypothetical protein
MLRFIIFLLLSINMLAAQNDTDLTSSIKISPPQTVVATDGTLERQVQITWEAMGTDYDYLVVRSMLPAAPPKNGIVLGRGWQASNHISDRSVEDGKFYYYFVKARKRGQESFYSSADKGYSLVIANDRQRGNDLSQENLADSLKADMRLSGTVYAVSSTISLAYMLENGQKQAISDVTIQVHLSKDEVLNPTDVLLTTEKIGRIEAQATKRNLLRLNLDPSVSAGNYWLLLSVASTKRVLLAEKITLK